MVSSSSSMDGAYSNIYNVLQQNYGQRRNSYPFDDIDSKKVCNKYYSLEKLNVSMEFEGQLHIRDKTPISVVLSKWKSLNFFYVFLKRDGLSCPFYKSYLYTVMRKKYIKV